MEFNATDLLWTKNVKREKGDAWAYMEYNVGDLFYLNWPRGRANMGKTDAGKVKINELVLLFQSVNNNSGSAKGTYLTHIITPVEAGVITDENSSHPFKRLVIVVAKCDTPIPKPVAFNFQEPNRGWACSLDLIKPFEKLNLNISFPEKQRIFWELFANKDLEIKNVNQMTESLIDSEQIEDTLEGEEKYFIGRHKYYERDPAIIALKKQIATRNNQLFCEVCKFDFNARYGEIGSGL
jgi:hypothetical protein